MSSTNKPVLRIDWATHKAASYACLNWHYSKRMPRFKLVKIGAWENDKFIGVVLFGWGATSALVNPYGLKMTQGCELTRIALKEHKSPVSKIMSLAIKFLKKANPGIRLIVSFADPAQGHHGGIYQATNWIYTGKSADTINYTDKEGKSWHARNVGFKVSKAKQIMVKKSECIAVKSPGKLRYLMPLDKEMSIKIAPLAKPYPKRVKQAMTGDQPEQRRRDTDPPAPLSSNVIASEQTDKPLISLQKAA